tara:strand:+ start:340 stop:633 length:294 start_codon:yes stop_codon:yes gene_type:complete
MKTITLKLNRKLFETLVLLYETSDFIYTNYNAVKIVEDTHTTGTIEIDRDVCFKLLKNARNKMVDSKTNYMQGIIIDLSCKMFDEAPYDYDNKKWLV